MTIKIKEQQRQKRNSSTTDKTTKDVQKKPQQSVNQQQKPFYKTDEVAPVKRRIPVKTILMKTIMNRNIATRNRIISVFKDSIHVMKFTNDTISPFLKKATNQSMNGDTNNDRICRGILSQSYFKQIDTNKDTYNAVLMFYGQRIIGFSIYKIEDDSIYIDILCTNKFGITKLNGVPLGQILLEYVIYLVNGRQKKKDKKTTVRLDAVRTDDTLKFYYNNNFMKSNMNQSYEGAYINLLKMERRLDNTNDQRRLKQKKDFEKFYQDKKKRREYLKKHPNYKDELIPIQNGKGIILHNVQDYSDQLQAQRSYYLGNIKYIGDIKQNKKSGVGKEYHKFGYPLYQGQYKNGERDGKGTLYKLYHDTKTNTYTNRKLSEGTFSQGNLKEGKKYDSNGNLLYHGKFNSKEKIEEGKKYHSNGKINYDGKFNNGKFVKGTVYDQNGQFLKTK
jgi:antitoxin component YwqK of YwqJK toxin-antitoxin module